MRRWRAGDVGVVLWQEWAERLSTVDGRRSLLVTVAAAVLFFGILIPATASTWWGQYPAVILVWAWMPMFLVADVAADTFAGARERNTLETLLVSRLSNGAILGGKLLAVFAFAWLLLLLCLATGMLAVTLVTGLPPLLQLPTGLLAVLAVTLLVALFTAAAGVMVSMRAHTLRQAQQVISLLLFAAFLTVAAALTQLTLRTAMQETTLSAAAMVGLLLAAVDAALLIWLAVTFRRSRLLLDG